MFPLLILQRISYLISHISIVKDMILRSSIASYTSVHNSQKTQSEPITQIKHINVSRSSHKILFLTNFKQTQTVLTNFSKNNKYTISRKSIQWKLCYSTWTHRQMGWQKGVAVTIHFENVHKKVCEMLLYFILGKARILYCTESRISAVFLALNLYFTLMTYDLH